MSNSYKTVTGTTVSLEHHDGDTLVIVSNPDAPEDMRRLEAGRIVYEGKGFQPAPLIAGAFSPNMLRAIASVIEMARFNHTVEGGERLYTDRNGAVQWRNDAAEALGL